MPVSLKYLSLSLQTSITDEACPLPMPFVSLVIHIEPPPIPTFTKSAPASAKNLKPLPSTTLPPPIKTFLYLIYFYHS